MRKVLVIEDDSAILELIEIHLNDLDCQVFKQSNGLKGFQQAQIGNFDLIILDLMLPQMNGIDICNGLRKQNINTPIFMLTAKSEAIDKILGLELGADDYMTKPFNIREFTARVKAIFRRLDYTKKPQEKPVKTLLQKEELQIDLEKRLVLLNQKRIELTPKEFDLLALLASNPGKSYNREKLLKTVWGYQFEGYEHTVNSHINRLRIKIEPDMSNPKFIKTTWGIGYRFGD